MFAVSTTDLGRIDKLQHAINTGDCPSTRQPARHIYPHRRDEVRKILDEMLEKVVEPSKSPWASPIVLVQKKDGTTRFCVDYRKLNNVTRKDAYPLRRIDTTLDTLAGSKWLSTLDLLSGYWQVELEERARQKTAFCTTEGLFQFRVMPFGLCNAPATFQRLMYLVLAGLQWSHCLVYLDDVVVLGRSFDEHVRNLELVFRRLREAGLRLKPSKCSLFRHKVQYLGHIISREGVAADPSKIEKVGYLAYSDIGTRDSAVLGVRWLLPSICPRFRTHRPAPPSTDRTPGDLYVDRRVPGILRRATPSFDVRSCSGLPGFQPPVHPRHGRQRHWHQCCPLAGR